MEIEHRDVKTIHIQIYRAENLFSVDTNKNKKSNKWRVLIFVGKKKFMTEFVVCSEGNPYWNYEEEIKLSRGFIEPIVLVVTDTINNQYGQIEIPLNKIKPDISILQCSELEPNKKCLNPIGTLFYKLWVGEYFTDETDNSISIYGKRNSIFGFKYNGNKHKSFLDNRTQSTFLDHSEGQKVSKRLSFFKSSDKRERSGKIRSKAKSMCNIHIIEDVDQQTLSDLDAEKQNYLPSDDVYYRVTQNFGWIRVEDACKNNNRNFKIDELSIHEGEQEKVELLSVQPDNGPLSGNFVVVIEGNNFSSGLFDLTYILIDGLEPIDATTCTKIISDTEILLTMPPVSSPGMVNIHLELLDGFRISCSKTFHYVDCTIDSNPCSLLTPTPIDDDYDGDKDSLTISNNNQLFYKYHEQITPAIDNRVKSIQSEVDNSSSVVLISNVDNNNNNSFNQYDRRRLSDYGSQGSCRSDDPTYSCRRKFSKKSLSKLQLKEEVETLRKEVSDLRLQLKELENTTSVQLMALKFQIDARDMEIFEISRNLCNLKMQLLDDGLTKYLELM